MPRAATEVMQSILFSAVLDAVAALKANSGGLPNNLLRDVQALHANSTFADLPKPVQDALVAATRSAFTQMLKEGYAIGPKDEMRRERPLDRVPERERRTPPPQDRRFVRKGPGRRGPGGERGPGGNGPRGPRPGGGPKGGGGKPPPREG